MTMSSLSLPPPLQVVSVVSGGSEETSVLFCSSRWRLSSGVSCRPAASPGSEEGEREEGELEIRDEGNG